MEIIDGIEQSDDPSASTTLVGNVELATDAETVTGTSDTVVTTPGNITARLAAPGTIGGTTPAAGAFTTLSASTGLSADFPYNEKHQVFGTTLTSDNTASGDIITVTFGETVAFGKLCYPDGTDNEWKLALATNAAVKYPAMGVALESKNNGESGKLLVRGLIRDATYFSAFALGDILYLSDGTSGSWVNAAPSDSGDIVQIVGWVLAANYGFFSPCYTYVEVS